jgi:hypothetical protein
MSRYVLPSPQAAGMCLAYTESMLNPCEALKIHMLYMGMTFNGRITEPARTIPMYSTDKNTQRLELKTSFIHAGIFHLNI